MAEELLLDIIHLRLFQIYVLNKLIIFWYNVNKKCAFCLLSCLLVYFRQEACIIE